MNNANLDSSEMEATTAAWMKFFTDQIEEVSQMWFKSDNTNGPEKYSQLNIEKNVKSSMEAMLKGWKALTATIAKPEALESLFKGSGAMPDILARLVQTTFSGYLGHIQSWLERGKRLGQTAEGYTFNDIDENIFQSWTEMYEKEFQQFFRIPKVGLVRTYQERFYTALDKYNIFQSTMAEFIRLLSLPINKSFVVMQQNIGEMVEKGDIPNDTEKYYQMWIKILEGHFMKLFQSPEYLQTLAKTLASLSEFSVAKDAVFEDILRVLPIPNRSEIDDLEREIYELKKRIRIIEKQTSFRIKE
jgi:hypothetical protein